MRLADPLGEDSAAATWGKCTMLRTTVAGLAVLILGGSAQAGPSDLFEEKVRDFGPSARGSVLVHYFRFTNTTNQTLTLGQPRVSCGCVSASVSANQVAPGESAAVIAQMDTRRIPHSNVTKAVTVYVPFHGAVQQEVHLSVQTVCRDDLFISPSILSFGSVKKGEGGKVSTQVTFTSDPNWEVTEATCTGGYVKVESKPVAKNGTSVTYQVTATLDPDCPEGNWTADIYLKTNNQAVSRLWIPVSLNVTAGVVPAAAKASK